MLLRFVCVLACLGACGSCDIGFFCPTEGQQMVCPAGFYCSTMNLTFPPACPFCDVEGTSFETCVTGYFYNGQKIAIKGDSGMLWFDLASGTFSAMATPSCASVVNSPVFSQNGKVVYFYDNTDGIYGFIESIGLCVRLTSIPNIRSLQLSYEEDMLLVFATDVYFGCYSISMATLQHTYLFFLPSNTYVDFVPAPGGVLAIDSANAHFYSFVTGTLTKVVGSPATTACVAGVGLAAKVGTLAAVAVAPSRKTAYIYDRGCRQIFRVNLTDFSLSILCSAPALASWYPKMTLSSNETSLIIADYSTTMRVINLDTGQSTAHAYPTALSFVSAAVTLGCNKCPAGAYGTACALCPPGTFTHRRNSVNCSACGLGTYAVGTGSVNCTPCEAGYVCATPSTHIPCAAGQFCPTGSIQASACPAGSFCSSPASISACPVSSFCLASSTAAVLCPTGSSSQAGASQCTCNRGLYMVANQCTPCAAGFFCDNNTPAACPSGTTSTAGAASYLDCWRLPTSTSAQPTPTAIPEIMLVSLVSTWIPLFALNSSVITAICMHMAADCVCDVQLLSLTYLDVTTFCDNGTEPCLAAAFITRRRVMAAGSDMQLNFIILSKTAYTPPSVICSVCFNQTMQTNILIEYTQGMSKRTLAAMALNPPTPAAIIAASPDPTAAIIAGVVAGGAAVCGIGWGVRRAWNRRKPQNLEGIRIEPKHVTTG